MGLHFFQTPTFMTPGQLVPNDEDTLAMCNISNYSLGEMA